MVTLVVVLVGVIGTTTYLALRFFLYDRLDQQLSSVVSSNAGRIAGCFRGVQDDCSLGDGSRGYRTPQTEWVTVLYATGLPTVSIRQNVSLKLIELSQDQAKTIVDDPESARTITTSDGVTLRVTARQLHTPEGEYTVVSGLSTGEINRTLGRLVTLELTIGGAAVVVAMFATAVGVRFSLRRLRRVTVTAQEVASELSPEGAGLDRRVPEDEPDTEVGHLATSFNTMLAAVETQFAARVESEQRMRQFLADASHELRTPLTSIRGYAELARMQRAVGDSAPDNLDRIESEGTRMSRLVEDLLLLARGDAAADDEERPVAMRELIDVPELLDDVVSGSRAAFPERTIELQLDPVPAVMGDRDQLLRAVRNLVANASVHTDPGRPITVHGFTRAGGLVVTVVDGGPGLPPEQAAHVFERFWRADKARTRARGGSGLGLSIVAAILRAHGGSVRFDSSVEDGSTVTVWLPAVG